MSEDRQEARRVWNGDRQVWQVLVAGQWQDEVVSSPWDGLDPYAVREQIIEGIRLRYAVSRNVAVYIARLQHKINIAYYFAKGDQRTRTLRALEGSVQDYHGAQNELSYNSRHAEQIETYYGEQGFDAIKAEQEKIGLGQRSRSVWERGD